MVARGKIESVIRTRAPAEVLPAPDPTDSLFGVNSPTFTFHDVAVSQAVSTNSTIADLEDDQGE